MFMYYGAICACCGEDEWDFLTLDHIDEDAERERYPGGGRITGKDFYQLVINKGYPAGLQLLCRNCNWGKHVNNGVCPHND